MSVTALNIVTDALQELGVLGDGQTASAAEADDALRVLNRLLDVLSNNQAFSFFQTTVSRALTGEASFTIGPTGDIVTSRPINIESAYLTRSGANSPVRVLDNQLWDSITNQGVTGGDTMYIYYEATMPNGIVKCYPLATGCTLNLRVINQVATFPALATAVSLPPGYEDCLVSNLAVRLSPKYPSIPLSPITVQAARSSLKQIHRQNNVVPTLSLPSAVTSGSGFAYSEFLAG